MSSSNQTLSQLSPQNPLQISVKEASIRLQLTERSVLNFIKQRRIDAVKVGKEWFVDYSSFVAFRQRYQLKEFVEPTEIKEVAVSKENRMSLASLRVFHHSSQLFESENFRKNPTQDFEKRIRELSFFSIENLGAGFHSFGTVLKLKHYNQARGYLGAILALLFQNEERRLMWKKEIEEIETHILPAFGALLRKIEKRPSSKMGGEN